MTKKLAFLAIASAILAIATISNVAMAGCNPAFQPYGLIGQRYADLSAKGAIFGCPVEAEKNAEGPGRIQNFEHGAIAWSPNTGTNDVQAAWLDDDHIAIQWGDTFPFSYDKFMVHWTGIPPIDDIDQDNINGSHSTSGTDNIPIEGDVTYRIVIEGCDVDSITGSHCKQGWSNPLYIKADRKIYCTGYANDAINADEKLGYPSKTCTGPRWQNNFANHFGWCMANTYRASHDERKARYDQLAQGCHGNQGSQGPGFCVPGSPVPGCPPQPGPIPFKH